MEGMKLDQFKKSKPSTVLMAQFYSHLSNEYDQYARTTTIHLRIIILFLLS